MPTNVFANRSFYFEEGNKVDTAPVLQKLYLRANYIESNFEKDIDMTGQFETKTLKNEVSIRKTASKNYVDTLFDDPSTIENTAHADFNDKNLDNVGFVKVNSMPAVGEHSTAKQYVGQATFISVDEPSLFKLDLDGKLKLDEQDFTVLNPF